jgi:transposase
MDIVIKLMSFFVKFLEENMDNTVEKIIEKFGNICIDTVHNFLKKLNYTYKNTFPYQESDKEKRKEFITKIKEEDLVFIDDSSIEHNEFYAYGWAPRGIRLFADKPGFKRRMISIIGALNAGKVNARLVTEGYCNSEIFAAYVENVLIAILKRGQSFLTMRGFINPKGQKN